MKRLLFGIVIAVLSCGGGEGASSDRTPTEPATDGAPSPAAEPAPPGSPPAAPRKGPPYPIVLAPGFGSSFFPLGEDYYWKVVPTLRAEGHQVFFAPNIAPFETSEKRGLELLTFIDSVLAKTNAAKVNVFGYSQGGNDARVAAHYGPERIAVVATIGTPNRGTPLADLEKYAPAGTEGALDGFFRLLIGKPKEGALPPNMEAAVHMFATSGAADFNTRITDQPGVRYLSVAGRTNLAAAHAECDVPNRPAFMRLWDDQLDPADPVLSLPGAYLTTVGPNDGFLTVESAKWGEFLGCVPADHLDLGGQIAGDSPGVGNRFDHLVFYSALANYLVSLGY